MTDSFSHSAYLDSLDVDGHLGAVERSVRSLERDGQDLRIVSLARTFPTTLKNLWDAVTSAERVRRWFLPLEGDLRLGGRFQLEGNAGGDITVCKPPKRLELTWEFGGRVTWVTVQLAGEAGEAEAGARLVLEHTSEHSEHWTEYGPGATGVGWEMGLMGLASHIADPEFTPPDPVAFATSDAGRRCTEGSSAGWANAAIEAGEDPEAARAAAKRTATFYRG